MSLYEIIVFTGLGWICGYFYCKSKYRYYELNPLDIGFIITASLINEVFSERKKKKR